jgi:hypothetical protein
VSSGRRIEGSPVRDPAQKRKVENIFVNVLRPDAGIEILMQMRGGTTATKSHPDCRLNLSA